MKILKKIMLALLTTIMLTASMGIAFYPSQAANNTVSIGEKTYYYVAVDRAPRATFDKTKENELIINFKDNYNNGKNSVKSIKIEDVSKSNKLILSYEKPTKNSDPYFGRTNSGKQVTANSNLDTVKIPADYFEVNKAIKIRITTTDYDKNPSTLKGTYIIKRLAKKNSNGNYFSINCAPTMGFEYTGSQNICKTKSEAIKKLRLKLKDNNGIISLEISDRNSGMNRYYSYDQKSTEKIVDIDLEDYKAKNGRYKLKIKAVAGGKTTRVEQVDIYTKTQIVYW